MQVLDRGPAWFLFEEAGELFLDANCDNSAFGYSWMIQLNPADVAQYRGGGRPYLDRLAEDIHNSVPILKDSTSIYKGRDVTKTYREKSREAFEAWRATH